MSWRRIVGPDGLPLDPVERARVELSRKVDAAVYGQPVMVLGPDGKPVYREHGEVEGLEAWLPKGGAS